MRWPARARGWIVGACLAGVGVGAGLAVVIDAMNLPESGNAAEWAAAIIVLVAAVIALWQLDEARTARRNRERPFVVVEFDVFRRLPFVYLVVKNYGATLARNVTIDFDPPLASSIDLEEPRVSQLGFIVDGIPSLAPGREIETLFDSFIQRKGDTTLPDRYTVTVSADGDDGKRWTDMIELDLDIYRRLSYIGQKDIGDLHKMLEKIQGEMHRWTAGFSGLHVRTDRDLGREAESRAAELGELRSEMARSDPGDVQANAPSPPRIRPDETSSTNCAELGVRPDRPPDRTATYEEAPTTHDS